MAIHGSSSETMLAISSNRTLSGFKLGFRKILDVLGRLLYSFMAEIGKQFNVLRSIHLALTSKSIWWKVIPAQKCVYVLI